MELINPMAKLAEKVGADILIFPLSEDSYLYEFKSPWSKIDHPSILAFILRHG